MKPMPAADVLRHFQEAFPAVAQRVSQVAVLKVYLVITAVLRKVLHSAVITQVNQRKAATAVEAVQEALLAKDLSQTKQPARLLLPVHSAKRLLRIRLWLKNQIKHVRRITPEARP